MRQNLKELQTKLAILEETLQDAYINYAKRMDTFTQEEFKKINCLSDAIIEIKKEIKELMNKEEDE